MTHPYFSKIFNSDMEKMETTSHKFTIFWGGKIIAPDSRKVIFNGTLFNAFFFVWKRMYLQLLDIENGCYCPIPDNFGIPSPNTR